MCHGVSLLRTVVGCASGRLRLAQSTDAERRDRPIPSSLCVNRMGINAVLKISPGQVAASIKLARAEPQVLFEEL